MCLHFWIWTPVTGGFLLVRLLECYWPFTGHSYIDSDIHLIAPRPTDKSHAHTKFLTSVNTFNAPLKVSVAHDDSTPPSEFHLRAANNLAESHITLDPKYTGTFDLRTKLASAVVDRVDHDLDNEVDDSSKQRNFQYDTQTSTHMFGWVGFGQRPGPTTRHLRQGHVEIHSSHSQVLLQLQGAGVDSSRSWSGLFLFFFLGHSGYL